MSDNNDSDHIDGADVAWGTASITDIRYAAIGDKVFRIDSPDGRWIEIKPEDCEAAL